MSAEPWNVNRELICVHKLLYVNRELQRSLMTIKTCFVIGEHFGLRYTIHFALWSESPFIWCSLLWLIYTTAPINQTSWYLEHTKIGFMTTGPIAKTRHPFIHPSTHISRLYFFYKLKGNFLSLCTVIFYSIAYMNY